ncbi:hypothetical protein E4416_01260 [Stenotrophomonas maltophilia]|uniref:hypothetical protein n=1 Tax=Stenotrophomonas maltophilia TaxID=40324 RepID=UPI0011105BDC|nr:hypothetical protein [Stenotrophomonas maltophilia]TIK68160.1 hypothetical protein E4418_08835 [Stenotrophomonas maltophilia]TIK75541.1 hypothetical protein E4416_01260 [Stenotrophomonas maltophilia]
MPMFNRLFGKSSGLSENEKRDARASQSYAATVKAVVEKGIPTEGDIQHLQAVVREITLEPFGMRRWGRARYDSTLDDRVQEGAQALDNRRAHYPGLPRETQDSLSRLDLATALHMRMIGALQQHSNSGARGDRINAYQQVIEIITKEVGRCDQEHSELRGSCRNVRAMAPPPQDRAPPPSPAGPPVAGDKPPSYQDVVEAEPPSYADAIGREAANASTSGRSGAATRRSDYGITARTTAPEGSPVERDMQPCLREDR